MVLALTATESPPAVVLCGVCGADVRHCPTCEGTGEVIERDERAYRRQGQPPLDPPETFDYPTTCQTCGGDGRHVCLPHQCDCCDRQAQVFDVLAELHLCLSCRDSL